MRQKKFFCIIPCGKRKIWDQHPEAGPVRADAAYIGIFHGLCQNYARLFFDHWGILSAKHGLLLPDDIVPGNYDLSFSDHHRKSEMIEISQLREQAEVKGAAAVDVVVMLGGKKFQPILREMFPECHDIQFPLQGSRGIGDMQKRLKDAIENRNPIHKIDFD
ncbi:DUF6884 domain-containing protein [Bacillus sp. FSL W8-1127]|uniref:DUF6884 domain-containing protein n=1 Tax=Bacillus TaxID=1386 RepID=UPI0030F77FFF